MNRVVRRILEGLLAFALVFLFFEVSSRLLWTVYDQFRPEAPEWFASSAELGWERKPNYRGLAAGGFRSFDEDGFVTVDGQQLQDESLPRIVFIGDSNTYGYNVSTSSTFVEQVDNALPNWNAINLGVPGYTSYQGNQTLETIGLDLNPDLLVTSFNFNDRRYILQASDKDGPQRFKLVAEESIPWNEPLKNIYIYRLMDLLFKRLGLLIPPGPAAPGTKFDVADFQPRVSLQDYEANLRAIAETASEHDLPLVFLKLDDNPVDTAFLRQGLAELEAQQFEAAIEHLLVAVRLRNDYSDLARLYLADAYEANDEPGRAESVRQIDDIFYSVHGGHPIHLDSEYHEIMLAVADDYGVSVINAGAELEQYPAAYVDGVHFNEFGHELIAKMLVDYVQDELD